jgi:hypothetical protein
MQQPCAIIGLSCLTDFGGRMWIGLRIRSSVPAIKFVALKYGETGVGLR